MSAEGPGGGERIYRGLLRLYPPSFRRELERELVQGYRDRLAEARHGGARGRAGLWMLVLADLAASVPREWWRSARGDRAAYGANTRGEEGTGMGTITQDLAFAVRSFARRPGFTGAMVATLAVGIGAATTLFSVLDGVVLRPLPYPDAERLVQLGGRMEGSDRLMSASPAEIHAWDRELRTLDVAGSRLQSLTLAGDGEPERLPGAGVSTSFFGVLGVDAVFGRVFGAADDDPSAPPVAVLTHGVWTRRWGADAGVLGRRLTLDGTAFTVIGVLPADYVPPEGIYHGDVEVYIPLRWVSDDVSPTVFDNQFLQAIGRIAGTAGPTDAAAELDAVQGALAEAHGVPPENRPAGMMPLHERTVGDFGRTLLPFLGAVGLLLLVACANVANLSLVRATERRREMAVRTALGAGSGRLARQLLTESLLTAAAASLAGAALAWAGVEAFRRFAPRGIPRASEVAVDPRVLGFALSLAIVTGLLFGLAPVLHAIGARDAAALRERGGDAGRAGRLRSALVVVEIAMALVLFVGAGLLAGSFVRLVSVDLGFEPERMAWMTVAPEGERWESPEGRAELFRSIQERLAATPGVVAVGGTSNLPLGGNRSMAGVTVDGWQTEDGEAAGVSYNNVLPGYFEAAGIEVLRGRGLEWSDDLPDAPNVVVNEAMARQFWADGDALGGRLHFGGPDAGDSPWMTVVGVAADVRQETPAQPPTPELYIPFPTYRSGLQTFVVRADGDPAALVRPLRDALAAVAPEIPVYRIGTMDEVLGDSVVQPRFFTLVLGAFAAVSLLLALVGVYGTMAYTVRQRTRELGVRMALGADRGRVRGMVLRRGLSLTAAGLVLGVGLALVSTRLLADLVYGVTPTDPATIAGAAVALAAAAALASWVPAARATRIDPTQALRAD